MHTTNETSQRALVIEDSRDIAKNIAHFLEADGWVLDFAYDGIGGLHLALTGDYDVLILDLSLPGMDGLTLCRKYRETVKKNAPVLMLTARNALADKLEGFDAGADDYLVKPFALRELKARLHALVKRGDRKKPRKLQVGELELNLGAMTVHRAGKSIRLNKTCMKILEILMEASPDLVSRNDLEFAMWGDEPPGTDALRSHIYTLRRKIDKPFPHPMIHTVHGMGYQLRRRIRVEGPG